MREWLASIEKCSKSIGIFSITTEIHQSRSKTLADRVRQLQEAITFIDPNSVKLNDTKTKGYFSMLLATFEEIADYFKILQKKDKALAKRVLRFGSDEESFLKWNETLQNCATELKLGIDKGLFDANQDLQDFKNDLQFLQNNLSNLLEKATSTILSIEEAMDSCRHLLDHQQTDRIQYKSQQAVKAEMQFDPKLMRFEKIIGVGGFGEVWKAKYRGDHVAIKKVPAKNLGIQAINSLKLEADFMKKLSHPRIVACFGLLEFEGNYCMIMELCPNGSLASYILTNQSKVISSEKRNEFALDIVAGMNYLHKLGVIHRDLKPGNIVLDKHDRTKITDFGLSVVKTATQTSMKLDECGTPQYMAPESFGLVPIFSTKSDVYAFSIVLWELYHWRTAYENVSILEIKDSIKEGDRLPIDETVAPETKKLIKDCWDDNPKNRPTFAMIMDRLSSYGNLAIAEFTSQTSISQLRIKSNNTTTVVKKPDILRKPESTPKKRKRGLHLSPKLVSCFKSCFGKISSTVKAPTKRHKIICLVLFAILFVIGLMAGSILVYVYITTKSANQPSTNSTVTTGTKTIYRTPYPTATVSLLVQDDILLKEVLGITLDEEDNLYVTVLSIIPIADRPSYPLIYKISQTDPPVISLIANLSFNIQGNYNDDQGLCYFNKALYVPRMGQIMKIDLTHGNMITKFTGSGSQNVIKDGVNSSAYFDGAEGCVADPQGYLYVYEFNGAIRKVAIQDGRVDTVIPSVGERPWAVQINGSNILYTAFNDFNAPRFVNNINLVTNEVTHVIGNSTNLNGREGPANLIGVYGLAGIVFDELGNLYFIQTGSHSVWKFNITTNYVTRFAGNGYEGLINGLGPNARFSRPRNLVFDSQGRLIIADQGNNALRIIHW